MTGDIWRVPSAVTRVYLAVEADCPPGVITSALRRRPTTTRRYRNALLDQERTFWAIDLGAGHVTHDLVKEAGAQLLRLPPDVPARIRQLLSKFGGTAAFVVAQAVSDDPVTTGIEFSTELLEWLAGAGAFISVDQQMLNGDLDTKPDLPGR